MFCNETQRTRIALGEPIGCLKQNSRWPSGRIKTLKQRKALTEHRSTPGGHGCQYKQCPNWKMEQIGAGLVKQLALGRIPVIAPNENQKTGLFCRHSGRRVQENARTLLRMHHPMQQAQRLHKYQGRQE